MLPMFISKLFFTKRMEGKIVRPFRKTCQPKGWRILGDQFVGSGIQGDVFKACFKDDCGYVAKVMHLLPEYLPALKAEKNLMYALGQKNLSPEFKKGILCKDFQKLAKIITNKEDFDAHRSYREENALYDIQSLRESKSPDDLQKAAKIESLMKSPLYGVLFSKYVPESLDDKKRKQKALYEAPVRKAMKSLLLELAKLGIHPDLLDSNNIRVYQDAQGQWVAKLIDLGFTRKAHAWQSDDLEKALDYLIHDKFEVN